MRESDAPWPRRPAGCPPRQGVLVVDGELDCATAPLLAERLTTDDAIAVVDLSGVTFIDAFGLSALLAALRSHRGPIAVRALSPPVRRLLSLAELPEDLLTA